MRHGVTTLPVYNIKVNGRNFKVEVLKSSGDSFTVKIDDKTKEIKLIKDKQSETSFSIIIDGKEYKIEVSKVSRREPFIIKVEDVDFKVQLQQPERKMPSYPHVSMFTPAAATTKPVKALPVKVGEGAVTAPMTGKIVSVKVKEGEKVKAGQVICILEAMKMENEITAPKSGIIREIRVSEGMAVNEGEVLLVIE